jgi:uncharacterized protein YndB with AHSA1/START domain
MQIISVQVHSRAQPERVWSLLADTGSWSRWGPFDEATLERAGSRQPEGVGAVRRFRTGRRITRERVVAYEPPRHFAYELVSGLPLSNYRADVTLSAAEGGGTLITWESTFRGRFPVPAWAARRSLEAFIRRTAAALAGAAASP